jgi:alpha-mannosidase
LIFEGFKSEKAKLPCEVEADNISLEVIKKAEKENCLIVRIVETKGQRSETQLRFNSNVKRVVKTNLIEWINEKEEKIIDKMLNIRLKPFELRTYKVYLAQVEA